MSEVTRVVSEWWRAALDHAGPAFEQAIELRDRVPGSPTTHALVIGALVGLVALKISRMRSNLPPGPFALPLLGNLLSMMSTKEPFYVTLRRWAKEKYGPVISVYMGPVLCVILNDADVATEALVKKGDDFAGRPHLRSMEMMSEGYKDIAMADYTPAWKLHRKIAMTALRHYMTGRHLQEVVHEAVGMVAEKMAAEPGPFDPRPYNNKLMFRIIEAICFGGGVKALDDPALNRLAELFDAVNREIGNGFLEDIVPLLHRWPTAKYKRARDMMQEFFVYLYQQIDAHRASFSPDHIRDLADSLLLAQSEAAREESPEVMAMFTDTHIGQTTSDMFGAGIDTSRMTLDWALLLLAGNPKVQQRAQAEIDAVCGERMPETTDRPKLPFTLAVVYETLRIGVIAPTAVPHRTMKDTTVGGYNIPQGTMVMVNQWAILHDPDRWEDVEEFKPQRFLDEQGALKKLDVWMPFSAGKRVCLGENVAKPELLLIVACLLKRFTIALPPGAKYDPSIDTSSGIALCTPTPYQVVVTPR